MANPHEAVGQDVHQETTDELGGGKSHGPLAALMGVILVAKRHATFAVSDETGVGNRHAMRVASQILQYASCVGKRPFGVHYPFTPGDRRQKTSKGHGVRQRFEFSEKLQLAALEGAIEQTAKLVAKNAAQHPHGQK